VVLTHVAEVVARLILVVLAVVLWY
jgi:hypothetical protein